ncbi:hypothetical protein EYF80_052583 [Liparis tanakae]|uniref:Uncharacterized protein n=1 Tax=Liparis tanakae TaxID=230148 RepID=A0A4Z2FA68_9TELE|nr:hypothetical protein EYF80_052583 [Liparis tanakae]
MEVIYSEPVSRGRQAVQSGGVFPRVTEETGLLEGGKGRREGEGKAGREGGKGSSRTGCMHVTDTGTLKKSPNASRRQFKPPNSGILWQHGVKVPSGGGGGRLKGILQSSDALH